MFCRQASHSSSLTCTQARYECGISPDTLATWHTWVAMDCPTDTSCQLPVPCHSSPLHTHHTHVRQPSFPPCIAGNSRGSFIGPMTLGRGLKQSQMTTRASASPTLPFFPAYNTTLRRPSVRPTPFSPPQPAIPPLPPPPELSLPLSKLHALVQRVQPRPPLHVMHSAPCRRSSGAPLCTSTSAALNLALPPKRPQP